MEAVLDLSRNEHASGPTCFATSRLTTPNGPMLERADDLNQLVARLLFDVT